MTNLNWQRARDQLTEYACHLESDMPDGSMLDSLSIVNFGSGNRSVLDEKWLAERTHRGCTKESFMSGDFAAAVHGGGASDDVRKIVVGFVQRAAENARSGLDFATGEVTRLSSPFPRPPSGARLSTHAFPADETDLASRLAHRERPARPGGRAAKSDALHDAARGRGEVRPEVRVGCDS